MNLVLLCAISKNRVGNMGGLWLAFSVIDVMLRMASKLVVPAIVRNRKREHERAISLLERNLLKLKVKLLIKRDRTDLMVVVESPPRQR